MIFYASSGPASYLASRSPFLFFLVPFPCSDLRFTKIVGSPVTIFHQGEDFAGKGPFLRAQSPCQKLPLGLTRHLVAVGKLLWVACYELVCFWLLGFGCYKWVALLLLWVNWVGLFLLLWVGSCALATVGRLLCIAGRSLRIALTRLLWASLWFGRYG